MTLFGFRAADGAAAVRERATLSTMTLGGLSLSLFGRAAPHAADAWQRNALLADASCVSGKGALHACGSLLSTVDLHAWQGKLAAFLLRGEGELHLCSISDCLGLHLQRPIAGNMTAVTVMLVPPGAGLSLPALTATQRTAHGLVFLIGDDELSRFCDDLALAARHFPVQHGHAMLPV